jgi:hypothetical protein
MASYCTVADLYAYGLPRGALANPARLVQQADPASDTLSLDQHGFALNDPLTLRAEGGGSLPAPLVAGVTVYAKPVPNSEALFQVAAAPDGPAINLTTAGSRILVTIKISREAAIVYGSALIDDMLPAHLVPLTAPYSPIVVITCAELANWKLLGSTGGSSKTFSEMIDAAKKRLDRWAKDAVPIRGENAPTISAAVPVAAAVGSASDSRGWNKFGGL